MTVKSILDYLYYTYI